MKSEGFNKKFSVIEDWIDYNGHMNDSAYGVVFSLFVDNLMDKIGLDEKNREVHQYTLYTLETHLCYLKEAYHKEDLTVTFRILDYDSKRIHCFLQMKNKEGDVLATSEQMLMGMDQQTGKSGTFPDLVAENIAEMYNEQKEETIPEQVGRVIGIRRKN
ncbi:acyl-CoA thioester hydrolase [Desulfitispora alkaliphila]|uniref:thioesterase family protein n=1 Tax=Desulfitispora alkaliphila TaxID=622674 RepID=UPI003D1F8287